MSIDQSHITEDVPLDPKFPIGRFDRNAGFTTDTRQKALEEIETLPQLLRRAVGGLDDRALDRSYRAGGWTIRQLVHHIADSHMNAYIRMKLALTEATPAITAFDQDRWSQLRDSYLPIESSLSIIDGVHTRWTAINRALEQNALARTFLHPELGELTVDAHIHLYAWHGRHHVAHITNLR